MNQIIDDAWTNYQRKVLDKFMNDTTISNYAITNKEEFINKCKTDSEFSKKWGLKIEERELSLEERVDWLNKNYPMYGLGEWTIEQLSYSDYLKEVEYEYNIPTKLITITYNNETIESHE